MLHNHAFIREKAQELLKECGFEEPPVDTRKIAEWLGLRIVELSLPLWFCGSLIKDGTDHYIVLNSIMPPERKNFTIAHEIAHHRIHPEQLSYLKNAKRPWNHSEADVYAAELCMPSAMVRTEADRWCNDHKYLARLFHVTEDVMASRLKEMGLTERPAR